MTATSHALIGVAVAATFRNPALAIPIALVLHVITDYIPHWDVATNSKTKTKHELFVESALDVAVGFFLSFFVVLFLFPQTSLFYAFFIIIISQLPDWITSPYYFFKIEAFKWAYKLQKLYENKKDRPWGLINQIIVVLGILLAAKVL
jgi:hypothetical protein